MFYKTIYKSPVGILTLISDGKHLTHLIFESEKYYQNIKESTKTNDSIDVFLKTKIWLDKYFNGQKPNINELNLKLEGTTFQNKVLDAIKNIPYGKVVTYKDIAKQIGQKSYRAIGSAISHNPIPIIIPCHRVVGTNKSLTGFSGGLDVKINLLKLEGVDTTQYKMSKGAKYAKM